MLCVWVGNNVLRPGQTARRRVSALVTTESLCRKAGNAWHWGCSPCHQLLGHSAADSPKHAVHFIDNSTTWCLEAVLSLTGIASNSRWQSDVYQILDDYLHNPVPTSFDKQNENILEKKIFVFVERHKERLLQLPLCILLHLAACVLQHLSNQDFNLLFNWKRFFEHLKLT